MMYHILGQGILAGLSIIIPTVLFNAWATKKSKGLKSHQLSMKDKRIRLLSEILASIKMLKMYAWEEPFIKSLSEVRDQELKMLRHLNIFWALVISLLSFAPGLMTMVTFLAYSATSEDGLLTADKLFACLTLINLTRKPVQLFSSSLHNVVKVVVSFSRIGKFLKANELDLEGSSSRGSGQVGHAIEIDGCFFNWDAMDGIPTLSRIELKVRKGELVAIVGLVGAGKSSLLSAVLGEMSSHGSKINIHGSLAYIAQQAWIQNLTLQQNVLCGGQLDRERYQRVIEACSLVPDLELLAAGDDTEIGENGVTLSGGQRQRVAIARAVYRDADIYLFDDPLSALDVNVGQAVFREVISNEGLLHGKTRLLVTHDVKLLRFVDTILVMRDGRLVERGSYEELANYKGSFLEFLDHHDNNEIPDSEKTSSFEANFNDKIDHETEADMQDKMECKTNFGKKRTKTSLDQKKTSGNYKNKGRITDDEDYSTRSVPWSIYIKYSKTIGSLLCCLTPILYFVAEGIMAAANYVLFLWTRKTDYSTFSTVWGYMGLFGALVAGQSFINFTKVTILFLGCLKASRKLHSNLLMKIMRCPIGFFERTPTGRILNRFSSDIDLVDEMLLPDIHKLLNRTSKILFTILIICYSTPMFLGILPFLLLIFHFLLSFSIGAFRQLKRLDMVTRSLVLSHFTETINGELTYRNCYEYNNCKSCLL